MMAQSRAESTRDTYNYGQYLNQFPPNTIKVIREFERIQKRICRHKMSIMFNEICIYIYIYIYPTPRTSRMCHKVKLLAEFNKLEFSVFLVKSVRAVEYTDCISAEGLRLLQWVSCGPVGLGCRIHRLHLCWRAKPTNEGPVGRGCRIHRLHLCRSVRPPH